VAAFKLLIKASAALELEAVGTKRERQRLVARISSLASEPRPSGSETLAGYVALLRIRQGKCRVVYTVDDAQLSAEVIKIGNRREMRHAVKRERS
jgi:mRNA interferase RelE/StbE